jgi:aryl-alcohol dehydrogenase-like predicted oxidoreductase
MDISRLALRFSLDSVDADVVLCGTARVNELEENIKNASTPLTDAEKDGYKIKQIWWKSFLENCTFGYEI